MRGRSGERLWPLLALSATLSVASLPHLGRLPWWFGPLMAVFLLARLAVGYYGLPLPGKWWLLPPTILGGAGVVVSFRPFFGGPGSLALLMVMAVLKLYEMKEYRDQVVVALLGYVLVASRFLYEQSPLTALWMAALTYAFTYLLVEYGRGAERRTLKVNALWAGKLLFYSLPLALMLFVLFPRTGTPLFSLRGGQSGITGLSDTMAPGTLSSLAQSEEIAFRAELTGAVPPNLQYYWRGPVFDSFDGVTWKSSKLDSGELAYVPGQSGEVAQTIIMESSSAKWLTPLDLPARVDRGLRVSQDRSVSVRNRGALSGPVTALSTPGPDGAVLTEKERKRFLALPGSTTERVRTLAASFGAGDPGPEVVRERLLAYLKAGNYYYTLTPPRLPENPVDEFLFVTHQGFCEHFASAAAVLFRGAGVPARVVTGYLGGEFNPFGGHWIVQEKDAHAWIEAYFEGRGWVRFDPTVAVSPQRIRSAIDWAASMESGAIRFAEGGQGLLAELWYAADSLRFWWGEWVVGFGPARQRQLLEKLSLEKAGSVMALAAFCLLLPFIWLGVLHLSKTLAGRPRLGAVEKGWQRILKRLAGAGLPRLAHEPPVAYAERVGDLRPEMRGEILHLAGLYSRCRYSRAPSRAEIGEFIRLSREFRVKGNKNT